MNSNIIIFQSSIEFFGLYTCIELARARGFSVAQSANKLRLYLV